MIGKIAAVAKRVAVALLDTLGVTVNGVYTPPSGGGVPNYSYKNRLVITASTSQTNVTCEEVTMREFTRGVTTDPVTFASGARLFPALNKSAPTSSTDVETGGFVTSPGNSTMWRLFLIGKIDGTVGLLASPFTASSYVEDDLPESQYIPSGYAYIREVGECYVDSSGDIVPYRRTGDVVELNAPSVVYSNTALTTVAAAALPAMVPYGCSGVEVYATTIGSTSSDVAVALRSNAGAFRQFQSQNIGFNAYGDAPTGVQSDRPHMMPWDGVLFIFAKSTKPSNASTGGQGCFINGYARET